MKRSNSRLSQLFLFDEKTTFSPSGVNCGAKLAQPKSVIWRASWPSASATNSSIFMGAVRFFASSSAYLAASVPSAGWFARYTNRLPSREKKAPPS